MMHRIAAVVVTYNRLELLKECLAALRAQTRRPDEIIVVNNGSTDGTAAWLATQSGLTVITQVNLGSSGGQCAGIKAAFAKGHDWFWCMDDDTIPDPDCLEQLLQSPVAADPATGFLASLVRWTDGTLHSLNRPELASDLPVESCLSNPFEPVRSSSFVSLLVRREAVEECGLPLAPLFIWADDVEFTRRLGRRYKGYLIPSSRALHKTIAHTGGSLDDLNDQNAFKFAYGLRNWVYIVRTTTTTYRLYHLRSAIRMIIRQTPVLFQKCSTPVAFRLCCSMLRGLVFNPRVKFPAEDKN